MNNDIGENFIFYETTQEIWEVVRETYFDTKDTTKAFEIEGIIRDLCQVELSITQYFSLLNHSWQRMDMFETTKWDHPMDEIKYKIVEKKQIYKFLLGLNKNLDEVRGRILRTKPLPNIQEVASEVS